MERFLGVQSERCVQCQREACERRSICAHSRSVRSDFLIKSHARLKQFAEKNRCAAGSSMVGAAILGGRVLILPTRHSIACGASSGASADALGRKGSGKPTSVSGRRTSCEPHASQAASIFRGLNKFREPLPAGGLLLRTDDSPDKLLTIAGRLCLEEGPRCLVLPKPGLIGGLQRGGGLLVGVRA